MAGFYYLRERFLFSARHALGVETRLAKDGSATFFHWTWLKGNLALRATLGTRGVVHRTITAAATVTVVLSLVTASFAALWSAKTAGSIKFLFAFREGELCTAIAARNCLVRHGTERGKKD